MIILYFVNPDLFWMIILSFYHADVLRQEDRQAIPAVSVEVPLAAGSPEAAELPDSFLNIKSNHL